MRRFTTKRPHLEPIDELISRIREASRFVPLERLAVSPQCGFSNSVMGNAATPADREEKLRLVVETARRVWGEDTALLSDIAWSGPQAERLVLPRACACLN